jgi:signal transduction histidine kinase
MVTLRDEDGQLLGVGKIVRSRSDLGQQFESLQHRIETLDSSAHRKDVFLSTLAHELNNPLAPLSNALRLIRLSVPDTKALEYPLNLMERQIQTLGRLAGDLLDLARIGAGKVELKEETVAIQDIVQQAIESASPLVRGRHHSLEVRLPPMPLFVQADPDRLVQVFVNLLNNAGKFTPEGGRISIEGAIEADEMVMRVRDTGIGIPRNVLPRIFEMFTQAEESRSHSQGGLGIGLAVVKQLVTLHGGSVQASSEGPGKGSLFTVRLPLPNPG